ncbi:hypothetical protein D1610_11925 [Sphingomonas gilva]|uniref:Lipoprotein n=2 Tax=Sphingomonas gilva TaxID=2305907 RepID=A0A396RLL0_9SPHN|nr:hypothetical protein D1610_11925 [Sphingomonas gilva]
MRISSGLALLLLAACGEGAADPNAIAPASDDAGEIECAAPGDAEFARVCTLDRMQSDEGLILTVRRPDGGFHRLLVTTDGRGVVSADGAEPATVSVIGDNRIEVAVGGARYRLPATVK